MERGAFFPFLLFDEDGVGTRLPDLFLITVGPLRQT